MLKEKVAKLIDVKSITTVVLTVMFCVLAYRGDISGQEFLTIFTVVVGFYYGTQSQKSVAQTTTTQTQEVTSTGQNNIVADESEVIIYGD